jgi:F0F1-type ATP synthase assembly protein I
MFCAAHGDMPDDDDRSLFLARSLKYLQENIRRSGPAAAAGYTLIGAIVLLGGLGYAIDAWRGTAPWFLLAGLTLGIVVGFYELAKTVWPR